MIYYPFNPGLTLPAEEWDCCACSSFYEGTFAEDAKIKVG